MADASRSFNVRTLQRPYPRQGEIAVEELAGHKSSRLQAYCSQLFKAPSPRFCVSLVGDLSKQGMHPPCRNEDWFELVFHSKKPSLHLAIFLSSMPAALNLPIPVFNFNAELHNSVVQKLLPPERKAGQLGFVQGKPLPINLGQENWRRTKEVQVVLVDQIRPDKRQLICESFKVSNVTIQRLSFGSIGLPILRSSACVSNQDPHTDTRSCKQIAQIHKSPQKFSCLNSCIAAGAQMQAFVVQLSCASHGGRHA